MLAFVLFLGVVLFIPSFMVLGSLSNNDGDDEGDGDGDGDGDSKKAIGQISKATTFHVHHTFLYVKVPNFAFCRGREHKSTNFSFFS